MPKPVTCIPKQAGETHRCNPTHSHRTRSDPIRLSASGIHSLTHFSASPDMKKLHDGVGESIPTGQHDSRWHGVVRVRQGVIRESRVDTNLCIPYRGILQVETRR